MAIRNALIAVDFDGTVVTHAYPEIGDDAGAVPVLKELTDNGCRLILYTMRHGKLLDDAIRWSVLLPPQYTTWAFGDAGDDPRYAALGAALRRPEVQEILAQATRDLAA